MHRVAHTGKLARAIVVDLALLDHWGDELHWQRALGRAEWIASRLKPDPEHGALIYHPGRLDPRNCSTSAIDSGECTDALARLLLHPHSATVDPSTAARLRAAVHSNAQTYLRSAVLEKGITNQRLWAAMGLATAWALEPQAEWLDALRAAVQRAIVEQHDEGWWRYQPDAAKEGAHPGAADLTVYYHSRCLAFLMHICERAPALDSADTGQAISRGLDFLKLVTTPDGLKPLLLEGKRWFWDGTYEAGSAAFDVFALTRGADLFARNDLSELAEQAWRQLRRHQLPNGSIASCLEPGAFDFVCADFHTADLAWTAQVISKLERPTSRAPSTSAQGVTYAAGAGVIRLESATGVALVRTRKQPANTMVGGPVGGGALAAVVDRVGVQRLRPNEGQWRLSRAWTCADGLSAILRFLRENPPGREGRQWLFVARLLLGQGRPRAAWRRLWRGYVGPLAGCWRPEARSAWSAGAEVQVSEDGFTSASQPTAQNGDIPRWVTAIYLERRVTLASSGLRVSERLRGPGRPALEIEFLVPEAAQAVDAAGEGVALRRSGQKVNARPCAPSFQIDVTYSI